MRFLQKIWFCKNWKNYIIHPKTPSVRRKTSPQALRSLYLRSHGPWRYVFRFPGSGTLCNAPKMNQKLWLGYNFCNFRVLPILWGFCKKCGFAKIAKIMSSTRKTQPQSGGNFRASAAFLLFTISRSVTTRIRISGLGHPLQRSENGSKTQTRL